MGIVASIENALLGAMIYNGQYAPDLFNAARTAIDAHSREYNYGPFLEPNNRAIYSALCSLADNYETFDIALLADHLETGGKLDSIGGYAYLTALVNACADPASILQYLARAMEIAKQHEIARLGSHLNGNAGKSSLDLTGARDRLDQLIAMEQKDTVRSAKNIVAANRERLGLRVANPNAPLGLSTGLPKLDKMIGGLQKGWLVVILANQNMGKTTACITFAAALVGNGKGIVFPTEMTPELWIDRLAAALAQVSGDKIAEGTLSRAELGRVDRAYETIEAASLDVIAATSPDIAYVKSIVQSGGYDWMIADSASKFRAAGFSDIYSVTSEVANGLQDIAIDQKIPVIVSVQAKPEVTQRSNRIPNAEDTYGGAIYNQNADVILAIYNHDYYVKRSGYDETKTADQQKHGVVMPDPNLPAGAIALMLAKHRHKEGVGNGVFVRNVAGSRFYDQVTWNPNLEDRPEL